MRTKRYELCSTFILAGVIISSCILTVGIAYAAVQNSQNLNLSDTGSTNQVFEVNDFIYVEEPVQAVEVEESEPTEEVTESSEPDEDTDIEEEEYVEPEYDEPEEESYYVEPEEIAEEEYVEEEPEYEASYSSYSGSYFKKMGEIRQNGYRYTWYSSNVLHHYRTSEWTPDGEGIYRDCDGYVVVASSDHSQGSTVPTPFGEGKVYDCGCPSGTIDVYVNF